MTAWSCCRNCSAADDGCAFGGRHRQLLHRIGCAGAGFWPIRLVHGVRQLFGTGSIKMGDGMVWNFGTIQPFTPGVLSNLISQPARRHAIMILPTARGKTVWRCDSAFYSSET